MWTILDAAPGRVESPLTLPHRPGRSALGGARCPVTCESCVVLGVPDARLARPLASDLTGQWCRKRARRHLRPPCSPRPGRLPTPARPMPHGSSQSTSSVDQQAQLAAHLAVHEHPDVRADAYTAGGRVRHRGHQLAPERQRVARRMFGSDGVTPEQIRRCLACAAIQRRGGGPPGGGGAEGRGHGDQRGRAGDAASAPRPRRFGPRPPPAPRPPSRCALSAAPGGSSPGSPGAPHTPRSR